MLTEQACYGGWPPVVGEQDRVVRVLHCHEVPPWPSSLLQTKRGLLVRFKEMGAPLLALPLMSCIISDHSSQFSACDSEITGFLPVLCT